MPDNTIEQDIISEIEKELGEKKVTTYELKDIVTEKVKSKMNFREDWQVHYAVERIEKDLQSRLKLLNTKPSTSRVILIIFLASLGSGLSNAIIFDRPRVGLISFFIFYIIIDKILIPKKYGK